MISIVAARVFDTAPRGRIAWLVVLLAFGVTVAAALLPATRVMHMNIVDALRISA